jgi:membrane protein implicated in regulation of membrane protease activity
MLSKLKYFFKVSPDIKFTFIVGGGILAVAGIVGSVIKSLPISGNAQAGLFILLALLMAFCVIRGIEICNEPKQPQEVLKRHLKVVKGGKLCK